MTPKADIDPWVYPVVAFTAVAIVVLKRETMFSRDGAVTEVLMPGGEPGARARPEIRRATLPPESGRR
jgi:hypothetical protein